VISGALSLRRTLSLLAWLAMGGPGPDGKPMQLRASQGFRFEPPNIFQYTFAMAKMIRRRAQLSNWWRETEATKSNRRRMTSAAEDDTTYAACRRWMRLRISFPLKDTAGGPEKNIQATLIRRGRIVEGEAAFRWWAGKAEDS